MKSILLALTEDEREKLAAKSSKGKKRLKCVMRNVHYIGCLIMLSTCSSENPSIKKKPRLGVEADVDKG